jgi:hypothetical protein
MPSNYERKTDRVYGAKMRQVREMCRQSAQISADDLVRAGLASDRHGGRGLLAHLLKRGEVRVLRPGCPVRNQSRPAIFTAQGTAQNPPAVTRHHENN